MKQRTQDKRVREFSDSVARALRRAGRRARAVARRHGVPVYVWENGKIVAEKP